MRPVTHRRIGGRNHRKVYKLAEDPRWPIIEMLMLKSLRITDVSKHFDVDCVAPAMIFDDLVEQGKAKSRQDAIVMVGKAFPPKDSTWGALAQWIVEYDTINPVPELAMPMNHVPF